MYLNDFLEITSVEHLPLEETLLVHYIIREPGLWELYQPYTAYRNVCDEYWTIMIPNSQHPRHDDFPILVFSGRARSLTFAWNYGGIRGISSENFDENHSYLTQLTVYNLTCSGDPPGGGYTGQSGNTGEIPRENPTGNYRREPPVPPPPPPPPPPPEEVPPANPENEIIRRVIPGNPGGLPPPILPDYSPIDPATLSDPSGIGSGEPSGIRQRDIDPVLNRDLFDLPIQTELDNYYGGSLFDTPNNNYITRVSQRYIDPGTFVDLDINQNGPEFSSNNNNISDAIKGNISYPKGYNKQDLGDENQIDLNQNPYSFGALTENSLNKFVFLSRPKETNIRINKINLDNLTEGFKTRLDIPQTELKFGQSLFIRGNFFSSDRNIRAKAKLYVKTKNDRYYLIAFTDYVEVQNGVSLTIEGVYNTHYLDYGQNTFTLIIYDIDENIVGYNTQMVNILPFLTSASTRRDISYNSLPSELLKLINSDKNNYIEFLLTEPFGYIFEKIQGSFSCVLLSELNDLHSFRIGELNANPEVGDFETYYGYFNSKIKVNDTDYFPEAYNIGILNGFSDDRLQVYVMPPKDIVTPIRCRLYYSKNYRPATPEVTLTEVGDLFNISYSGPNPNWNHGFVDHGKNGPNYLPPDILSQVASNNQRSNNNGYVQFTNVQINTENYFSILTEENNNYNLNNQVTSKYINATLAGVELKDTFPIG